MSNSFRRNTSSKNTLISRKNPVLNMNSSTDFPAMSETKKPNENKTISTSMNFMEKALVQPKEIETPVLNQQSIQTKHDIPALILSRLVHQYETWKQNYINEWGYSDYEKHYRFDDWDYEYFEKLDAADEIRLQEEERLALEKEADDAFVSDDIEQYEEYLQD